MPVTSRTARTVFGAEMSDRARTVTAWLYGEAGQAVAPTNLDLIHAVNDVLAASRRFRQLYGKASPEQQAAVMIGFPWPKRTLELRDMTDWATSTAEALAFVAEPASPLLLLAVARARAG